MEYDDNAPACFDKLGSIDDEIGYFVGQIYYSNWPMLITQSGSRKLFFHLTSLKEKSYIGRIAFTPLVKSQPVFWRRCRFVTRIEYPTGRSTFERANHYFPFVTRRMQ